MKTSWTVRTNNYKESHFESEVQINTKTDLYKKAFKKLAIFWGLAVFSVFIPVLHFFLVPLFLGLGVYRAIKTLEMKLRIELAELNCPECLKKIQVLDLWLTDEVRLNCEHCSTQLVLQGVHN